MCKEHRRLGLALAAGVVALAISLAGCGNSAVSDGSNGSNGGAASSKPKAVTGKIAISWWGSDERNQKTEAVIALWEKAHPGTSTDNQASDFGSYFTKLNVQAASQSLPCAIQLQGRQVNDYTKNDLLQPLDPLIKSGQISTADIPKAVLDAGRGTDGKLYFLPYGVAYDAVTINKTLAQKSGLSLPKAGYSWADFFAWLAKAKDKLPADVYAVDSSGGLPNFFLGYMASQGKSLFAKNGKLGFTEKDLETYWNTWERLRKAGVTVSADAANEEPTATNQGYIATGKVLVNSLPGNALGAANQTLQGLKQQELVSLAYPSGAKASGNVLYPSGFAISKNCDNVPAAASFIDFFTNDLEAGKAFNADNGAPTNTKVLKAITESPDTDPMTKHMLDLYSQIVKSNPPQVIFPAGYQATFEASFKTYYQDITFGKMSVAQAAEGFMKTANASLS